MVPEQNLITNHGYGVATHGVYTALTALGHEVGINDSTAPVEIAFTQPENWEWSNPEAYHIGYTPWESTRLPAGWLEIMETADEIWTTSPWCKRVFEKNGLRDVRVYMHGVETTGDSAWARKRRRPDDRPIRFLHMGEPAPRKAGQLAYETFISTFGDDKNVSLTIKAHGYNTVKGKHHDNVKLITAELEPFQLIDLIRRHDVLVYPSWGEGFGLIPLQAMATGMPVICTSAWAPYSHLLLPELRLPSKLVPSPWATPHAGNMYQPDAEALSEMMKTLASPEDYANYSARAYAASFQVEQEFDWIKLTVGAFSHIFEMFETA